MAGFGVATRAARTGDGHSIGAPRWLSFLWAALLLGGCTSAPLVPFTVDTPPLILVPAGKADVVDQRARFREIFCAVLDDHGRQLPDYRPCDEALTRVGAEPVGTGRAVDLGSSRRRLIGMVVPGIGFDCFAPWLSPPGDVAAHVSKFGFEQRLVKVDALSSSARNARQIRDAVMAQGAEPGLPRIVLVGYSKGIADVLEAVVSYPEMRGRVAAVLSAAGSVGGSPLANDATQFQANLLQHFPEAQCDPGDEGAVESLRPATRRAWLAAHPLPAGIRYYSLVAYPQPDQISSVLKGSYRKLAQVDGRNDSQMIFYDQVIPGSTLVGYLNADHWAVAVPIARTRHTIATLFVDKNAYPREALVEAVLRFIEEDLATPRR
jgi:hypothetical protein